MDFWVHREKEVYEYVEPPTSVLETTKSSLSDVYKYWKERLSTGMSPELIEDSYIKYLSGGNKHITKVNLST